MYYTKTSGWKKYGVPIAFVAAVAATFYPIFIHPMLNIEEYKAAQKINRKNIDIETVQPGGMNVWSDPFGRK